MGEGTHDDEFGALIDRLAITGAISDEEQIAVLARIANGPGLVEPLLRSISRVQRDFILDGDAREIFTRLLEDILELTNSEYGFIGEVEPGPNGEPILRTWAITNIAWTADLKDWYDENSPSGIIFSNLDTLFGEVVRTSSPVVANEPATDPRRGGLPEGHPPLDAFLGLPFTQQAELVGMVGLANRPGGYEREFIDHLEPLLNTCSALIGALRNRRQVESSQHLLRVSKARTGAILQSVVDAVVVTDDRGTIETFNGAAETTFDYQADDVLGQNVSILMTETDASAHDGYLSEYEKTGKRSVIGNRRELMGRRRNGSTFPLELSVAEVDIDGQRFFAGTCRDLTDKHQAEREIQMYAATIEATPDFVGVAHITGEILAINEAGRDLIGLGPDDPFDGLAIGDIHLPWSRDLVRDVGLPTAIRDGAWTGETAFVSPDGRTVPMSQVIVVSRNREGEAELVSTIARDISETKEIERVKDEFVSTVSHELRTPLTSIRGSLGLLAGGVVGELPEQAADMVRLALNNAERLIRLVNDILDFEKAQAGHLELALGEVAPLSVAMSARDTVQGAATERGISIEVQVLAPQLPTFQADADRLVQVLVNLLGNAIKFSPVGEHVSLTVDTDDRFTTFSVTDVGCGIAPADIDAIFEPFVQVDSSNRRGAAGTGLGLAISRLIVEAHGGTLTAQSSPGLGSTFTVALPSIATVAASEALAASDNVRSDVLIVANDASTRIVVRRLFEGVGLCCAEAATARDALGILEQLPAPALILMDIDLPDQDGFDLVHQLERSGLGDLPLVIYTGRDLDSAERDRLHLGPTRHLTMGRVNDRMLVEAVLELLDLQKAPETAETGETA